MAPLKNGNNRDNCSGDVTHGQPIGSKSYIGLIRELQVLMVIFIKKFFLIGYLI